MESVRIDILNPKAKSILKNLAELKLIRIKKDKSNPELQDLLNEFRKNSGDIPSNEEIASEVELVRKIRYEK